MNFKTSKDIILRVVMNFLGPTAVGGMILLIAMMFFAESIVFSKEVLGLLIGITIFCIGIGGLISAVLIFFFICTKKIEKLEKIISIQDKKLKNSHVQPSVPTHFKEQQPETFEKSRKKDIFDEINLLSEDEEITDEDPLNEEVVIDELVSNEFSEQDETPSEESSKIEDV